jgi:hypothetical protein
VELQLRHRVDSIPEWDRREATCPTCRRPCPRMERGNPSRASSRRICEGDLTSNAYHRSGVWGHFDSAGNRHRSPGRTLKRWRLQIAARHTAHVTDGPTEAVNNLIKRAKRAAFGFTSFRNYRIRSPLYAGKPNWSPLVTITPR